MAEQRAESEQVDKEEFTIVDLGDTISYIVPSFPVFTVCLRYLKWQYVDRDGNILLNDGFIRDCPSLNRTLPAMVYVERGYSGLFFIERAEFERSINVDDLDLHNNTVLVLWQWDWLTIDEEYTTCNHPHNEYADMMDKDDVESTDESHADGTQPTNEAQTPHLTHSVIFKCIGASKEQKYQETLCLASKNIKEVKVKLTPEEDNPRNARAIAFTCNIDGEWQRIGYVVEEVLDAVHTAIEKEEIVSVTFEWVKFVIHWSCPGWYAGINVTKYGQWPSSVVRSASARYVH